MSITDELRDWVTNHYSGWSDKQAEGYAIADRIDAEHEKATSEFWAKINAVPATDENMAEHGWVRLPVDADGEYIHIGERVQLIGNDPSTVSHMSLADDGWRVYVKYDGMLGTGSGEPKRIRHYHAPTVEDVLREMLDAWGELPSNATNEAIIAEYAAKLQLKEDA